MKDLVVTAAGLPRFIDAIQEELTAEPVLLVTTQSQRTGKWGMARLWRSWMATTADWMAARGATVDIKSRKGRVMISRPIDAEDCHELFTKYWLGLDADGTRLSWSRSGRKGMRAATKGERWDALRKHEEWALPKGIPLFMPRDSEYRELAEAQNA